MAFKGGYQSSDGTAGITKTTGGAVFKDGLLTGGEIVAEPANKPCSGHYLRALSYATCKRQRGYGGYVHPFCKLVLWGYCANSNHHERLYRLYRPLL
jgi:hypothetical protein